MYLGIITNKSRIEPKKKLLNPELSSSNNHMSKEKAFVNQIKEI